MATLRAVVAFGLMLTSLAFARAQEKQEKVAAPAPSAARPEFPLVVRIDDKALDPLRSKDVRQLGRVDRIVLGTRAIGTSETSGEIKVSIIPDRDDASFTIRFHGETRTRTSGSNGPAIIRSRTSTEFDCARLVVFDPRIGLVAGKSTSAARTSLVFDGFDTDRRLGRRLITRIAERRANEQFEVARAISQRDSEVEVRQAFDEWLDKRLVDINQQLNIARYVNALFGPKSKPHLATRSCQDCILVGIGNENSPRRLVTAPPEREKSAAIEIWVHNSLFGERLANLTAILETIEDRILPAAAKLQVGQVLLGPQIADPQFDVDFEQGWVVIGIQNDLPKTAVAVLAGR
jgi:hypothetical protein